MSFTVRQLAELVQGKVLGDDNLVINAARILQDAQPGDITFLDNPNHAELLRQSRASAAVVAPKTIREDKTLIQVADPLLAFTTIFQHLQGKAASSPTGIDPRAVIHPTVQIGADPSIDSFACIGNDTTLGARCRLASGVSIGKNCRLGDDVVVHPNVVLYDNTVLGDRVIVHANAVIGADGFGYRVHQGRLVKVPQLGNVVVGNDVEIGAGAAIDRATFGSTTIGDGTKIDNLVQIAHNCQIGKHNAFAAQVGFAGSCTTGNYVMMGGQAGVSDHVHLGDGVMVGAKTGIMKDALPGQRLFLYPAHEDKEAMRILACLKKLPTMRKDLLRVLKELSLVESDAEPMTQKPAA